MSGITANRVVVAHRGARDLYQVSRALCEADLLETLVTDVYWPADRLWACGVEHSVPTRVRRMLGARNEPALPGGKTRSCLLSGLGSVAAVRAGLPFDWKRAALRWSDDTLGRRAGKLAERAGAALLSYSYYGYSAFTACRADVPKILFQLHPHPVSVRQTLLAELERHPECAATLRKEWELALPEEDFRRIATEPSMASHWIAASSYTRQTLVEHGVPAERVHIIPYGVKADRFTTANAQRASGPANAKLKLLFVGSINQRKGIKYLLEALDLLATREIELTVCGWAVDDLKLFRNYEGRVTVRPSVSAAGLAQAYAAADLFVFPSLAEGFGHVLLEAMAAGLPIAATTRTAAPDLVRDGVEGFVFEPASAHAAAQCIQWALDNRPRLAEMGEAARHRARQFTWERFRAETVAVVQGILQRGRQPRTAEEVAQHAV